mgnify:CR=1 FL=1|jgi:hypothetical protein
MRETVRDLIKELNTLDQGLPIEIECPNGLLVYPEVKFKKEDSMNPFSKVVGVVVTYRG